MLGLKLDSLPRKATSVCHYINLFSQKVVKSPTSEVSLGGSRGIYPGLRRAVLLGQPVLEVGREAQGTPNTPDLGVVLGELASIKWHLVGYSKGRVSEWSASMAKTHQSGSI